MFVFSTHLNLIENYLMNNKNIMLLNLESFLTDNELTFTYKLKEGWSKLEIGKILFPIGIAYAIWSAVGIVLISLVGYFVYKQTLDLPAILGIALIIIGVVIINVFSKSASH